jgi:hypothetical protein
VVQTHPLSDIGRVRDLGESNLSQKWTAPDEILATMSLRATVVRLSAMSTFLENDMLNVLVCNELARKPSLFAFSAIAPGFIILPDSSVRDDHRHAQL